MGRMSGMVIFQKIWLGVQPSISAASNRLRSMPMTAAISRMVVLPNHIRKFISETRPRVPTTVERKRNGSLMMPAEISAALTGPLSEKRAKKSMANAEAIIRFGM